MHFTGREMVWECEELSVCECGHVEGLRPGEGFPMVGTLWRRGMGEGDRGDGGWMTLVEIYSRRRLTKTEDKLVAVAGIAELVGERTRDEYWNGVFRGGLPAQLLWAVEDEDELRERVVGVARGRPRVYRAPTWSWASTDGPVHYSGVDVPMARGDGGGFVSWVQVVGSSEFALPTAKGTTGTVLARELVLEGLVVPVALTTVKLAVDEFGRGMYELNEKGRGTASVVRPRDGTIWQVVCDFQREANSGCQCLARDIPHVGTAVDGPAYPSLMFGGGGNGQRKWEDVIPDTDDVDWPVGFDLEGPSEGPMQIIDLNEGLGYDMQSSVSDGSDDVGSHGRRFSLDHVDEPQHPQHDFPMPGSVSGMLAEPTSSSSPTAQQAGWCERCRVQQEYWHQPQFCCLRISSQTEYAGLLGVLTHVYFLVLSPSSTVPGAWERMGIGSVRLEAGQDQSCGLFAGGEIRTMRLV